mmetsp:Transcript_127573/g.318543  ORF Transcript_127573/g.318543 Transcript_127573/m.318543 type:complete len:952 (+) Transcript_127573:59-2914(+)
MRALLHSRPPASAATAGSSAAAATAARGVRRAAAAAAAARSVKAAALRPQLRCGSLTASAGFPAASAAVPPRGADWARLQGRRWFSDSLIDCSKVYAKYDAYGGVGTFAARPIKKGDLVERGVVRRLPVDGNHCAYVFTWSQDRTIWASGSGCSVFYNASLDGSPNTEMKRTFEDDTFEIYALRDIAEDEEVTHLYKSLEWRECFKDLKAVRDGAADLPPPSQAAATALPRTALVDCSKVYAKRDEYGGVGAYAAVPIKKGELVERGIVRRLPVDGNICPYVFTWSEDKSVWASGSGCSVFYNASLDGSENTEMKRFLDEDRFEIYATRDIAKDEEVTHLYKSIEWRECFKDLKAIRDKSRGISSGPTTSGTRTFSSGSGSGVGGFVTPPSPSDTERGSFVEYWGTDHAAPTLENMMLDSQAGDMDRLERPEILSALPSLSGKRVLELGAGIGRFSGVLAQKAGEVVAVDFVESSCAENRRANAEYKNLEVVHADVTMLELKPDSFDLVFSNWLLMYLTDAEVREFAKNMLTSLRPGGHLFFRESCFHASGDAKRRFNPTQYRDPETYSQIFSEAESEDGSRFHLLATNCLESYAKMKGNLHQMWFRWEKLGPLASERRMRMLQTGQYTPAHCLRYEKIYGRNYIYTGGETTSQQLLDDCAPVLTAGARCLDIGCGLGGTALYLAERRPDIFVHGVNHSGELHSFVAGRHVKSPPSLRERVTFELAPEAGIPENELRYPPNSFDAVIIRETLMYLEPQDKPVLLQKACRLLRPGGRLVVVDYCAGKPDSALQPEFRTHLQDWGYFLLEPDEQAKLLGRYFDVEHRDATQQFVRFMDEGLERIEEHFGPQAPVRQAVASAEARESKLEALRTALEGQVGEALPRLPSEAAKEAAQAALGKVALHLAAEQAEAEICRADYEWSRSIWELERRAATEGDLRWSFFTAQKKELPS